MSGPPSSTGENVPHRASVRRRRIWMATVLGGVLFVAMVGAVGLYYWLFVARIVLKVEPAAWQECTSPEGRFKVMMPGPIKRSKTSAGYEHFDTSVSNPSAGFGVSYADFSPRSVPKAEDYYEHYRKDLPKNFGTGRLVSYLDVSLGDYAGKELVLEFSDTNGTLVRRLFIVEGRLYMISVSGTKLDPDSPAIRTFLDSFQLTK
jgi:hypothetical protein